MAHALDMGMAAPLTATLIPDVDRGEYVVRALRGFRALCADTRQRTLTQLGSTRGGSRPSRGCQGNCIWLALRARRTIDSAMAFSFDPVKLSSAATTLGEVTLDQAQRKLVQELGDVVGPAIGVDPIPCRGIWLQAVRAWQQAHGVHAQQISSMAPPERLQAALDIKSRFVELASSMLTVPSQRAALQSAIDAAYKLYVTKYNKR
jgi:hypothetical protein